LVQRKKSLIEKVKKGIEPCSTETRFTHGRKTRGVGKYLRATHETRGVSR